MASGTAGSYGVAVLSVFPTCGVSFGQLVSSAEEGDHPFEKSTEEGEREEDAYEN